MVDDPAQEHRFTLARVTLDPEQLRALGVSPLAEILVLEHPDVRVCEQATLGVLDSCLVVPRVRHSQVSNAAFTRLANLISS